MGVKAMLHLKEPWEEPSDPNALRTELEKELSKDHYLHKFIGQFFPIARSFAADDVVYEIQKTGYVLVHLTWKGKKERANCPYYKMLPTLADVQKYIDSENEPY